MDCQPVADHGALPAWLDCNCRLEAGQKRRYVAGDRGTCGLARVAPCSKAAFCDAFYPRLWQPSGVSPELSGGKSRRTEKPGKNNVASRVWWLPSSRPCLSMPTRLGHNCNVKCE